MSAEDLATASIKVGDKMYKKGDHFYDDGNILILVQDTAFCVYRGILAYHSEVFALPPAGAEQIVGIVGHSEVPSIHLEEDPSYFTSFLDLIIPRGDDPVCPRDLPLILIAPLIRITSKYCVDALMLRLCNGLSARLPESAETLTRLAIYAKPSEVLSIIRAGHDRPELANYLPLSYYALATVEWETELWKSTDITPAEISKKDIGRSRLLESFGENSYRLFDSPCSSCNYATPQKWGEGRETWCALLVHPLETITTLLASVDHSGFCKTATHYSSMSCTLKYQRRLEKMRTTILDELPTYFDIPPASS